MSGTKAGGLKASKTNIKRYGKNFYGKIGAIGGRAGTTGGFFANPGLAMTAGALGGHRSRRGWKLLAEYEGWLFYKQKNGKKLIGVQEDDTSTTYDLRQHRTLARMFNKALRIKQKECR